MREPRAGPVLALIMLAPLAALPGCLRAGPAPVAAAAAPACLAGLYDGGQMELAAALELESNGHFRFALSYGALDEMAEGTWRFAGEEVRLTATGKGPGVADFADTPLAYREGELLLPRHGRLLRFRRAGPECKRGS